MSKRDYYDILGLAKTATDDEIKQAYRRLAMKYHPDRNQGDGSKVAEEKFKEVKEAYEHLSDPDKRSAYEYSNANKNPFENHGFTWSGRTGGFTRDDLDDFIRTQFNDPRFDNIFADQRTNRQQIHVLTISLVDAYIGKTVTLTNNARLTIPRGVNSGTKIFGSDGKLYRVDVQAHYKFKRSGDDLLVDANISAIHAMLGVEASIDHLDGTKLQFTIPAGIQPGQIVRLGKKGMKNPENDRVGDLLVRIGVIIPRNLTAEQIESLKKFSSDENITI